MNNSIIQLLKLTVIILFVLTSCKKNVKPEATLNIHLDKNDQWINLSAYADSISYIPLKTKGKVLLSDRLEYYFSENYLLIKDISTQKVLLFQADGTFLREIGALGKGPQEFAAPDRVTIDGKEELIFICSLGLQKILIFDVNGNHIRDISLSHGIGNLWILPNNELLVYTSPTSFMDNKDQYYHIHVYDYSGNIRHRSKLPLPFKTADSYYAHFYMYNQQICVVPAGAIRDSVYVLGDQYQLIPRISFQYDGLPDKHDPDYDFNQDFFYSNITEGFDFIKPPIETTELIFRYGAFGINPVYLIYDKRKNQSYHLRYSTQNELTFGFINDLDGGLPFYPSGQINEEWVYTTIMPKTLKNFEKYKEKSDTIVRNTVAHQHLQYLATQVNEDDDPVIMMVKFKNTNKK